MEVENATLWHQGRKCNIKVKNKLIKCNFMIENAIKVEKATSRKKMLHQCVSFSAKKNMYKDKIQRWLKVIWRWLELNQSVADLAQMILSSLPSNELSQSDSGSKLKSNFSSKICFTLIFVLDPQSLKLLIASNYGGKIF